MMNNTSNDNNSNGVGPYRATSNMNTYIDTPNANFNGMMNVNIQNTTTNSSNHGNNVINSNNNIQASPTIDSSNAVNSNYNNHVIDDNLSSGSTMINNSNNHNNSENVTKTYIGSNNKPKKKTMTLNLGPEFKIAFLIVVILLIFVFLLPYISDLIRGY